MRLRRGTTATFLSLQNYVFRGPPPYLSKHNKFPLCVSPVPPQLRLFHVVSSFAVLPGSATGTRLSFFHAGAIYLPPRNALLVYLAPPSPYPSVSVSPCSPREQHPHPHAGPRLSADPSTSIVSLRRTHPDRSQLPKSSIRDPTVGLPWDNPAVGNANNVDSGLDIYFSSYDAWIVWN